MHEVVNGANGSVTWCSGLGCPRCDSDRALSQRSWLPVSAAANPLPIVWSVPNTAAAQSPFVTYTVRG